MKTMIPRAILEELNRYIIGQNNAKRAVAIALRNRWRRQMRLRRYERHDKIASYAENPSFSNRYNKS